MSRHHEKAVTMIERQIGQIRTSNYPNGDFCQGMIQANYAQGHIDEQQVERYEQMAMDAVLDRRRELHAVDIARKLGAYRQLHGDAA